MRARRLRWIVAAGGAGAAVLGLWPGAQPALAATTTDTTAAAALTITFSGATETITISDGPVITSATNPTDCPSDCQTTTVTSSDGSADTYTFANKATLTIEGGGGGDSVVFSNPNPATGLVNVTLTGISGVTQTDALNVSGLGIDAAGTVTLTNAANAIDTLAATLGEPMSFTNSAPLAVGTVGGITGITSSNDGVTISADDVDVAQAINVGTATAVVQPFTAGRPISLGTEVVGELSLTDTEIDSITAGILRVGNSSAGAISVNGAISPAGAPQLELVTGADVQDDNFGTDITVDRLGLTTVTGVGNNGSFATLDIDAANVEARSQTDDVQLGMNDVTPLTIGGVSASLTGIEVVSTGDVFVFGAVAGSSINLADTDGLQMVKAGSTSGNVTLNTAGTGDITASADSDAITAPGGAITLNAGRDILLGTGGADHDNDVRARGAVTFNAGRDIVVDGFSDVASDDFGAASGGAMAATAGRDISITDANGPDASIGAGGTGTSTTLTTGAGETLTLAADSSAAVFAGIGGTVTLNTDHLVVASDSGVSTSTGRIVVLPVTAGHDYDLGSATDADAGAVELSSAELQRFFGSVLKLGSGTTGDITVSAPVSFPNVTTLSLEAPNLVDGNGSGADLTGNGLALRLGNGVDLESAITNLAFTVGAGLLNVDNTGALTVASLDGIASSSNAGTTTTLTASSPLTFNTSVNSAGTLTGTATDAAGTGDNLTVAAGVTLTSTAGDIVLTAGDNLSIPATAALSAPAGVVTLATDAGVVDNGTGSTVTLDGTFSATSLTLTTGADNDSITVTPSASTPITVTGGNPTPPASPGDTLFVRLTGTTSPSLVSTTTPTGETGTWSFGNRQDVDFSEIETLSNQTTIQGTVFDDTDGDGVKDGGEPGISGRTVELLDSTGTTVLATTATNGSGVYSFVVTPGTYQTRTTVPAGWTQTTAAPGALVAPESGTTLTADFGTFDLVAISGRVFDDVDGDGTREAGDNGLSGWTVFLDANTNGALDGGETSTTSAADGTYAFGNLGPGTYTVRQVDQAGRMQTSANPATIGAASGVDTADVDFGTFALIDISGTVFRDFDGDGTRDAGDGGLGGRTVFLDADDDGSLDAGETSTTTAADGSYSFADLGPGTYTVGEVLPSGWTLTTADPAVVTASSGTDITVDIGNFRSGFGGYALTASDGGVMAFDGARFHGSLGGIRLNSPVVGMAYTLSGNGYWLAAADGGVFAFGDAGFHGSTGGIRLRSPIVGIQATDDGKGYWLVAADGGVFAFGTASFHGSTGGIRLNQPIVGMAVTPDGKGYWLVARDGGVFAFGSAKFLGSMGGVRLNQPIVGMAADPTGNGYWLVGADGGIFAFGTSSFHGSMAGRRLNAPVVGIVASPSGKGYWLAGADGGIYTFGDAVFDGSLGAVRLNGPVVGIARPR